MINSTASNVCQTASGYFLNIGSLRVHGSPNNLQSCRTNRFRTDVSWRSRDSTFHAGRRTIKVSAVTSTVPSQKSSSVKSPGRNLLIAVDNNDDSRKALEWALACVIRTDDVVHLTHVVSDPRTPTTGLGSTSYGIQWTPPPTYPQLAREYWHRLEETGRDMVTETFVPVIRDAGRKYEVDIIKQRGVKSAAGIGEAICSKAKQLNASLVIIASHGAGVLADYGSVAQYCTKNSDVAVLVVPPATLHRSRSTDAARSGGLMVVALDDLAGLEKTTKWAAKNLHEKGEMLHAVFVTHDAHAEEVSNSTDGEAGSMADMLTSAVKGWTKGDGEGMEVDVTLLHDVANTDMDSGHSLMGSQLADVVDNIGARMVVLTHHGRDSTMREMMYGSVTTYFLRHCKEALVVVH